MAKAKKGKKKTGFLAITLTKCPKCGDVEISSAVHQTEAGGIYCYDYCKTCGHQWNYVNGSEDL